MTRQEMIAIGLIDCNGNHGPDAGYVMAVGPMELDRTHQPLRVVLRETAENYVVSTLFSNVSVAGMSFALETGKACYFSDEHFFRKHCIHARSKAMAVFHARCVRIHTGPSFDVNESEQVSRVGS